jgi:UPF0755 protein
MAEPLDPAKFHILTKKGNLILGVVAAVVLLVLMPVFGYFYYSIAINRPAQTDKDHTITIKSGQSVFETAHQLYQANLVNSEFLFNLYVKFSNKEDNIQAGVYKIPAGASIVALVDLFGHGTDDVKITFLDGWRLEEYVREASKYLPNVSRTQFMRMASGFEGQLYPDTYYFQSDANEETLINKLKETFNAKTKDILTPEALKKADLTKEQAMVFASIVEREVSNDQDRPIVAGILIKRWRNGELIGADATTQYAVASKRVCSAENSIDCQNMLVENLNWWPSDLNTVELQSDSPYNTRKNVGLPPTPISSFGLSALKAVLNSTDTEYNYYLTDTQGITHFAKTYAEHMANISKYL